ncbi:MAG: hypothetical protein ABL951_05630 [Alphaproteobacteria bacterium]
MDPEADTTPSDEDYAKQFETVAAERAGMDAPADDAGDDDAEIESGAPAAPVAAAVEPDPAKAAAVAPPVKKDDIWADAPAELRAAYEGQIERNRRDQIELQRLKAARAEPAAPPAKRELPPEVKKYSEEYPEMAGPTAMMLAPTAEAVERIEARLREIDQERYIGHVTAQEAALRADHPDFDQIKASKEFDDWLIAQPAEFRQIAINNSPNIVNSVSASKLVALFKAETRAPEPPAQTQPSLKRQKQLESASVPRVRGPAPAPDNTDDYGAQFIAEARARSRARA